MARLDDMLGLGLRNELGLPDEEDYTEIDAPPMYSDDGYSLTGGPTPDSGYGGNTGVGGERPEVDEPPLPDNVAPTPTATTSAGWTQGAGILEGFDAGKLADPNHRLKSPKYAFADVFGGYANSQDSMAAALAQLQQQYPDFFGNWQISGDDSIVWNGQGTLNDAFMGHSGFDILRNASGEGGGPGGWQWMSHTPDLGAPAVSPAATVGTGINPGAVSGGGAAPPPSSGAGAGSGAGSTQDTGLEALLQRLLQQADEEKAAREAFGNNIRNTISSRIAGAQEPVDPNDPIIADQMRAFRGNQERAMMMSREALAERGHAEGLGEGAFDSAIQSSYDNMGNAAASQEAGLLGERYSQKIAELQNMLSLGAGVMSDEQRLELESTISALQGRLREMDISAGRDIASMGNATDNRRIDLGYDTLGFQIGQYASGLDMDLINMILGR